MKKLLFVILLPFLSIAQIQTGTVYGLAANNILGRNSCISPDGTVFAASGVNYDFSVVPNVINGYVSVYKKTGGLWIPLNSSIFSQTTDQYFANSISLSYDGNVVAIGSYANSENGTNSGKVVVYQNLSGVWVQVGQAIQGLSANESVGKMVALSHNGNIMALSAGDDLTSPGYVKAYQNIAGVWTPIGQVLTGEAIRDAFGSGLYGLSLSSDGTTLAIGAPHNDVNGIKSGQVKIYKNQLGVWTHIGENLNGTTQEYRFGHSVASSSDGNIVAIAAERPGYNGYVKVFENISGSWVQIGTDINNIANLFISLSSDGTVLAIGTSSAVKIYQNISGSWTQVGLINEVPASFLTTYTSISLSSNGMTFALGQSQNSTSNYRTGAVKIYDLSAILKSDDYVQSTFLLYPNPVSEILTIQLPENTELQKAAIYNMLGQLIKTENRKEINVSNLAKGSYLIQVTTDKGESAKNFVVE